MTKSEKLSHVAAWGKSELSRPAYCRQHGLKYPTFMSWFKLEAESKAPGKFIAISKELSKPELVINFPNGINLHYCGNISEELIQLLQNA